MPMDPDRVAELKAAERVNATKVTEHQLNDYETERNKLNAFQVPNLTKPLDSSQGLGAPGSDVQVKVFTAFFDGTGNDGVKDPDNATNVYYMYRQADAAIKDGKSSNTAVQYIAGPGTGAKNQYTERDGDRISDLRAATRLARVPEVESRGLVERAQAMANAKVWVPLSDYVKTPTKVNDLSDNATGWSADSRANTMYQRLTEQTQTWKVEAQAQGKDIQVVVSAYGFSRGADTAALFMNKVEDRGIKHPGNAVVTVDKYGQRSMDYKAGADKKYEDLAPPGKTPQTIGLFDPVGTGDLVNKMNRQLPASVISGLQITAMNEGRASFKVSTIIPFEKANDRESTHGQSVDGRFLSLCVPGAHSDVGGSYICDGLANRSCNVMVNYQNALNPDLKMQLRDEPHINDCHIHDSVKSNVIFRADEWISGRVDRSKSEGQSKILNAADPSATQPKPMNESFNEFREARLAPAMHRQGRQLVPENRVEHTGVVAANARNDQAPHQGGSRESTDSMLNTLSRAASSNDMHMAQTALGNSSNPALAAREQGAQALALQRQQAQQPAEPQPQQETPTTSPTQQGRQPGR